MVPQLQPQRSMASRPFGRVGGVGHEAVCDLFRLAEARDIKAPDGVSQAREEAYQTIVLVVDIELMGGISDPMVKENALVGGHVLKLCPHQVEGDTVAGKRDLLGYEATGNVGGIGCLFCALGVCLRG